LQVTLSIIIVTYNPGPLLLICVASLRNYLTDPSCEIIIVDNASTDGVIDLVQRDFPEIKIISNTDNRGFAAANNQGLAAAQGDYLLLLNPDTSVRGDALGELQRFVSKQPHVGIVGPRTFDVDNRVSLTAHDSYTPVTILWQYLGFDRLIPHHIYGTYRRKGQQATDPFEVRWVQGSCMMFRREVYEQIGGLDEELFLFSEEPDYCERAATAGWHVYYVPTAEIDHYESTTVSRYPLVKIRNYHISPLHYFRKRQKGGAILVLQFGFTLELLMKLMIRFLQLSWLRNTTARARLLAYLVVIKEVWQHEIRLT
jgi:GT2 family glycosyltransferase